jgi:hypothetical protein
MLKYYGRTFLPWIVLAIVSGFDAEAGALAGLATAAVLLIQDRRGGKAWDALILETSTAVYMALLSALALAAPGSAILHYGASLAIGWLAVTAWATLAAGRPFTEGIARRQVSAEIAATELFQRINVVITAAWAAAFSVTALVLAGVQHWAPHDTALLVACKVAGFTVPAVFTARYPTFARDRHLAKHDIQQHGIQQHGIQQHGIQQQHGI